MDDDAYDQVAHNMVELMQNAIQAISEQERLAQLSVLASDPAPGARGRVCT